MQTTDGYSVREEDSCYNMIPLQNKSLQKGLRKCSMLTVFMGRMKLNFLLGSVENFLCSQRDPNTAQLVSGVRKQELLKPLR